MKIKLLFNIITILIVTSSPLMSQVQISGILDFAHTFHDKPEKYDTMFRGDNSFHTLRSKIFLNSWLRDDIGIFVEIWHDDEASSRFGGKIRVEGAFIVFMNLLKKNLNLKIGKIAHPFGTYAQRTYSNINPLISSPLIYSYHTSAREWLYPDNKVQIDNKRTMSENQGLPIIYDVCWDTGIALFSSFDRVEYIIAVTNSTISSPFANANKGKQIVGRLGVRPTFGLKIGTSYAYGPYLSSAEGPFTLPVPVKTEDFKQFAVGFDLEYSRGYFMLYAEYVKNKWDALIEEDRLENSSWYIEAKYKLTPRLYFAFRYDQMIFNKISDGKGNRVAWDYDLIKYEGGFGYKITKEIILKLVQRSYQFNGNHFLDENTTAVQLSIVF